MKRNKISNLYDDSCIYSIFELDNKYSSEILKIYPKVLAKMEELDGWGFKILRQGEKSFTCAFLFMENNIIMLYVFGWNGEYTVKYH